MKGYKATYNFKCRGQEYKVGKVYTADNLEICKHGFHFCKDAKDTPHYYQFGKNFVLLEIEALGEVIDEDDKSVTNKMKVIREIPFDEYKDLIFTVNEDGNLVFNCQQESKTYDTNRNEITIQYKGNPPYHYTYTETGKMETEYSEGSSIPYKRYVYDEKDRLIEVVFKGGPNKDVYKYDDRGNLVEYLPVYGQACKNVYNEKNQKIETRIGDKIYTYEYDDQGNMVVMDRGNGEWTKYIYENNRLIRTEYSGGESHDYPITEVTESDY